MKNIIKATSLLSLLTIGGLSAETLQPDAELTSKNKEFVDRQMKARRRPRRVFCFEHCRSDAG